MFLLLFRVFFGADCLVGIFVFFLRLKCKKNQRKSIGHAIDYDILTKFGLFKKYLLGSEQLIVKLASGISNIEIGQAVIVIPIALIEFVDKLTSFQHKQTDSRTTISRRKFPIKSNVFDAQQRVIGKILMDFEMIVYDRIVNEMELQTTTQPQFNGIENNMNHVNKMRSRNSNKSTDKLWMHSDNTNSEKSIPNERTPLSSTAISTTTTKRISSKSVTVPSPLLNYLTGRPLHGAEETEAVQAMASTSPTESLIDQLSYDLNGLYLPKRTFAKDSIDENLLKKIDCMRIHISDLCLTRAGIREILSKANGTNESAFGSGKFTVSIEFDSILSATTTKSPYENNSATFSSKVIRIFDTSIETIPPGKCAMN